MDVRVVSRLVGLLLVISAGAFVVGVAIERSRPGETHREASSSVQAETGKSSETHSASTETVTNGETGATAETAPSAGATTAGESATTTTESAGGTSESGGETSPSTTESGHATETSTGAVHSDSGEKLLGIKTESTGLVVAAIVASISLALALWFLPASVLLLLGAAGVGVVFAAFDLREATHQSDPSDTTLVVVALTVAALHLAVTAASGLGIRVQRRPAPSA